MEILPSKRFILVLLIILLIGGGWFLLFKNKEQNTSSIKYQKDESEFIDFLRKNTKDSDNDGLKDWEEVLWRTDPNNPDTDGDGTLDGEEVKENRNPTIAGPDDLFKTQPQVSNDEFQTTEDDSLSKEIAIKFFTEYIKFKNKEEGGELSESAKEELVKSLLPDFKYEGADKYSISDIKVLDENTKKTMKKYGNKLGIIIDEHKIWEHELTIFGRAIEEENEEELSKLEGIADVYISAAKDILELAVPPEFKDEHLALINGFTNVGQGLKKMQKFFQDALGAFMGFNQYKEGAMNNYNALKDLKSGFIDNNIVFKDTEPGILFINLNFTK